MRFGAAAAMALIVACSAAPTGPVNIELGPEHRRPRRSSEPALARGEPVSLDQLVRIRKKNARRKRRRRA
jgi:hypothetical protein